MKVTSWKYPGEESLENLIERKKLYPITILKSVNDSVKGKLIRSGVVMIKNILDYDFDEIQKRTNISSDVLKTLVDEARRIYKVNIRK